MKHLRMLFENHRPIEFEKSIRFSLYLSGILQSLSCKAQIRCRYFYRHFSNSLKKFVGSAIFESKCLISLLSQESLYSFSSFPLLKIHL